MAIPYIKAGLERNERCLYIADDNSVAVILKRLEEAGVEVDEALKRGALTVATKQETYLRHGVFEPEQMIAGLKREVEISLEEGYAGFRATGEMTWSLDLPSALTRIYEYESKLHEELPAAFVGLCQYDETRFPEQIIQGMVDCHSVLIRGDELIRKEMA